MQDTNKATKQLFCSSEIQNVENLTLNYFFFHVICLRCSNNGKKKKRL